jgi:hypothetical protein
MDPFIALGFGRIDVLIHESFELGDQAFDLVGVFKIHGGLRSIRG